MTLADLDSLTLTEIETQIAAVAAEVSYAYQFGDAQRIRDLSVVLNRLKFLKMAKVSRPAKDLRSQ